VLDSASESYGARQSRWVLSLAPATGIILIITAGPRPGPGPGTDPDRDPNFQFGGWLARARPALLQLPCIAVEADASNFVL
jgi:hypothetical protein